MDTAQTPDARLALDISVALSHKYRVGNSSGRPVAGVFRLSFLKTYRRKVEIFLPCMVPDASTVCVRDDPSDPCQAIAIVTLRERDVSKDPTREDLCRWC